MDIDFKSNKLRKLVNDGKALVRQYGAEQAQTIMLRMSVLQGAMTLAEVPAQPPERRHKLHGDMNECWAVCLRGGLRIVLRPQGDETDPQKITAVTIVGIGDYHE